MQARPEPGVTRLCHAYNAFSNFSWLRPCHAPSHTRDILLPGYLSSAADSLELLHNLPKSRYAAIMVTSKMCSHANARQIYRRQMSCRTQAQFNYLSISVPSFVSQYLKERGPVLACRCNTANCDLRKLLDNSAGWVCPSCFRSCDAS